MTIIRKNLLKEVDRAESDIAKLTRENVDLSKEQIPMIRREIEEKKEQRRNIEQEVKALKEGKDNS